MIGRASEARLQQPGITPRELEILEALASGASNREIAGRLDKAGLIP